MNHKLTTSDHSRDIAGLKYIYPVISRRAGGLSIGVNFNTNNACNWRCVYCQVPGLIRGAAPEMDFLLLEREFRFFLDQVLSGDFFDRFNVPESQRVIKDVAISGNGEPSSLRNFDQAIALIGRIATEMGVLPESSFVLISNGSLMNQTRVQNGLKILNQYQGRVWYKLDSATEQGRKEINNTNQTNEKTLDNLKICSALCETYLQSCVVEYLAVEEELERKAFIELLSKMKGDQQIRLNKILLYTIARHSMQPEAEQLNRLSGLKMDEFADQIRELGYEVTVSS